MIEDYGLPRWSLGARLSKKSSDSLQSQIRPLLVNNALTLRNAATLAGKTPIRMYPISPDGRRPLRRSSPGIPS